MSHVNVLTSNPEPKYKRLRAIMLNTNKTVKSEMLTDEKCCSEYKRPCGGQLQRSQFLQDFVEKPTHKGGDLGQREFI